MNERGGVWGERAGGRGQQRGDSDRNRSLFGKPLTTKQVQVIELLADGHTSDEVAKILGCAQNTVRSHISTALRQTGARDRTHLVAIAFRTGVLPVGNDLEDSYAVAARTVHQYAVTGEAKRLRVSCGLTTRAVAKLMRVSADTILDWEAGTVPSTVYMIDYARILRSLADEKHLPKSLA